MLQSELGDQNLAAQEAASNLAGMAPPSKQEPVKTPPGTELRRRAAAKLDAFHSKQSVDALSGPRIASRYALASSALETLE